MRRLSQYGARASDADSLHGRVGRAQATLKYVSRGGLKLEKAMTHFGVALEGKVCMDVGSSTGGFTDCMLQNGAVKVYAVDVGHGQLDWKLRNDERVVCMEKTNIRYVTPEDIADRIQFVGKFISVTALDIEYRIFTADGCIEFIIRFNSNYCVLAG